MRYYLFVLFLLSLSQTAKCIDINVRIYHEKEEGDIIFYANNDEFCPVTIEFDFELVNMKSTRGSHFTIVIPERAKHFLVTRLSIKNENERNGFKVKTNIGLGDNTKMIDDSYIYELPYEFGKTYKIYQGYNGRQSHEDVNALDFSMQPGDTITASRDGVVVKIEQSNTKSCSHPSCVKYNNYVLIYHADGSVADYAHIMKNGSLVNEGDTVKVGQPIALSGDVGYTSGPHLHFEVFTQTKSGQKTIRTKFRTQTKEAELLKEGKSYTRIKI
ncbi:MAG: M23 family metallopeptidase [Saprospiraceae bacterium]|nr:M23 family metallopeptidase [Saprospiraceae bacterium]